MNFNKAPYMRTRQVLDNYMSVALRRQYVRMYHDRHCARQQSAAKTSIGINVLVCNIICLSWPAQTSRPCNILNL